MTALFPSRRQTLSNVTSIWGARLVALLAPLTTTPIVANSLGLHVAGLWVLVSQLTSQLMLLDAGLANSLIRLLVRHQENERRAEEVLATAFWVLIFIASFILVISPFIMGAFVSAIQVPTDFEGQVETLLGVAIVYVALSLPLRTGYGMLGSCHRFDIIQITETLAILSRVGLIVLVFWIFEPTVLHLGLIVFGCTLLCSLTVFLQGLSRFGGAATLRTRGLSKNVTAELISMSGATFMITLAAVLHLQISATLVGIFIDTRSVAILSFPVLIYLAIIPFFSTFAAIAGPIAASAKTDTDLQHLLKFYFRMASYLVSGAFAVFLVANAFGARLLEMWLIGDQVTQKDTYEMAWVLNIILLGFALSVMAPLSRSILSSLGKHWQAAYIEIFTSCLGVGVGVFLMLFSNLGAYSMAIGIASTLTIRGLICYPLAVASVFKVRPLRIVKTCLLWPVLAALTALVLAQFIRWQWGGGAGRSNLFEVTLWVVPALVWIVFTWTRVIPSNDKQAFLRRVSPRLCNSFPN